jgi:hypothetical protein
MILPCYCSTLNGAPQFGRNVPQGNNDLESPNVVLAAAVSMPLLGRVTARVSSVAKLPGKRKLRRPLLPPLPRIGFQSYRGRIVFFFLHRHQRYAMYNHITSSESILFEHSCFWSLSLIVRRFVYFLLPLFKKIDHSVVIFFVVGSLFRCFNIANSYKCQYCT